MGTHWGEPASYDRLDEVRRDAAAVAALWQGAQVLPVGSRGVLPTRESATAVEFVTTPAGGPYDPQRHWLLGRDGDRVSFTMIDDEIDGVTIREVGAHLAPVDLELSTMAVAMAEWHRLEPHCPRCGGPSLVTAAGSARTCPTCRRDLFPRTDPAVIVAVVDESDRLLLGHQASWPAGRFSVLAGFVEAGESLEQAVHREVLEEVGVRLHDVTYVASQPWPFPRSIMLGFTARATGTEIRVDGTEIVEARWFPRQELRVGVASGEVGLPTPASIASRLVAGWLNRG